MDNNSIKESELIISEHGAIYHLNLTPEQLAPTVITVGHPDRVKEVSKYFDRVTHKGHHREFVTHTGFISNKKFTVVSTGIGTDNIDIVLNELDALVNIDFKTRTIKDTKTVLTIIRLGTCGSLQGNIPVDSLVVSSHGIGLDNLMHYYKHTNTPEELSMADAFSRHTNVATEHIYPYVTEADITLYNYFTTGYMHGLTATCPGFYAPQGRILRGPVSFPNLLDSLCSFRYNGMCIANFEMETAGIYGLGRLLGHKCLSISTVVANRADKTFSKDADAAIEHMIKHSLEIIVGMAG
jgi:uridine phosphorylase